ncbi:MAG: 16S rRNA (cytosine(1402)-N(4))-methyltransferase RsmH [Candidatus Cloacimonadales bacterium]
MENYHIPVFLSECVEALNLRDEGIYVDATLGGGGHSQRILQSGKNIKLFAFDQDPDAIEHNLTLQAAYPDNLILIQDNFANLRTQLALHRIKKIDGILFDLGISSHQIDLDSRGFSFSLDGKLDMRMDQSGETTAADFINSSSLEELTKVFREYGEEKQAYKIAKALVQVREAKPFETTKQFSEFLDKCTNSNKRIKTKARIFQAIRIYINRELEVLHSSLTAAIKILNPGGRIVVLSYHSLEDRLVKQVFRYEAEPCICPPGFPQCVCDKVSRIKILTKKPLVPSSKEIAENSRARSAKLRIAEARGEL